MASTYLFKHVGKNLMCSHRSQLCKLQKLLSIMITERLKVKLNFGRKLTQYGGNREQGVWKLGEGGGSWEQGV